MSTLTYIFAFLILVTVINSELVCPGFGFIRPQEPCVDQCSADNDTCGSGQKCCYTPQSPCGYRCVVGKQNVTKSGSCPSRDSDQSDPNWFLCDGHSCDVDNDCRCKKKCCHNKCGSSICISPEKKSIKKN